MAAIAPTATNVRVGSGSVVSVGLAGEAIEQFEVVYLDSATGKYKLADNSTAAKATAVGIAVTKAALDVYFGFVPLIGGYVDSSSALYTKGVTYVVAGVGGDMMPAGDITAGMYVTIIGVASSTTSLKTYGTVTGLTG